VEFSRSIFHLGDDLANGQDAVVDAGEVGMGEAGGAVGTRFRAGAGAHDRQQAGAGDEDVHAVEDPAAVDLVEAVQQEGFQEASVLRLAGGQDAADLPGERVGRAGGVGRRMGEEVGGIAHDGKTDALDKALFAVGAGERRQVGALAEFPVDLGEGVAVVLQEAVAGTEVAGLGGEAAGAVVQGVAIGLASVGDVDQQGAVADGGVGGHEQGDAGRVFDHAAGVAGGFAEVGDGA
jgi:hypothetical protein